MSWLLNLLKDWIVAPILMHLFGTDAPKRQPDAEAQDDRVAEAKEATRAETQLKDQQAAVAASGDSNATVQAASADAAASTRGSVLNPASVDFDPSGHWRS